MNRIDQKFADLKKRGKKAFIPFITVGYPNLKVTEELVYALEEAGADIIELGVPFSDPMADGPTIQAASQAALDNGVNLDKVFALVANIRKRSSLPIVLMTYYNPVFHCGDEQFVKKAVSAGVDGVIIPDLPPEEGRDLIRAARKRDLSTIFFLSPTTTAKRAQIIIKESRGFIYYVSITGVTGERQELPKEFLQHVRQVKRNCKRPICVGFGVSTAAQVQSVYSAADGVIVGSAIIKQIEKYSKKSDCAKKVAQLVKTLIPK